MLRQMEFEQEAARRLNLHWTAKMYCPAGSAVQSNLLFQDPNISGSGYLGLLNKAVRWRKLRKNYHKWLLSQESEVDVFLLRYYVHDPYQLWFILSCNKPVYLVHHSLEVPELAQSSPLLGRARSIAERILGKLCISQATGSIAVTQEILSYETRRGGRSIAGGYVYPNGVIYDEGNFRDLRVGDVPEIIFVANFATWHGLDIILRSVQTNKEKFVLHVVGDIPNNLKTLIGDERVVAHGRLSAGDISVLSARCWVGLSAFALSRKGMRQACPLKVREYLSQGLPVYGACDDIFPPNVRFYRNGAPEIREILRYAVEMRAVPKPEIAREARAWTDKKVLVEELYKFLDANSSRRRV